MPCPCAEVERANLTRPPSLQQRPPFGWEAQNGCDAEAPNAVRYFDGQAMTRCARRVLPAWVWDVVALYPAWEAGAMPNEGGVLSQPAPLVDALRCVAATLGELAMAKHERADAARSGPTPDGGARARAPVQFSGKRR